MNKSAEEKKSAEELKKDAEDPDPLHRVLLNL